MSKHQHPLQSSPADMVQIAFLILFEHNNLIKNLHSDVYDGAHQ